MRLLVFQHLECEHPGSLRQFLKRDSIEWDAVELDKNEAIPELDSYDALWVMGGPMDVWDVEEYPWLIDEKAAIRTWVRELRRPFLGLCLGHQLLADALGGTCGPQRPAEIGVMDVELTDAGVADPLFAGLDRRQKCLNWHSVQVAQAPDDAVILASSSACANQAMRVAENAWSMQYHVEVEPDTVTNWADIPAYHAALINSLGEDGVETMSKGAAQNRHKFLISSETIYNNFMRLVGA
jgi:GMP synthase-like glutamine amidotransferase